MSDINKAVTAAAAAAAASAPTPDASSPRREQSQETAVTTSDSSPQAPATDNDNSDARRCVICTEDVAEDDVCWIETYCRPHRHVYHNDCLALWWIEKEQRHCPRCTQDVHVFAVRTQTATGESVFRVFDAGPDSEGPLHEPLLVQSQSRELDDAMPWHLSADYGWPERRWTAQAAVGQWQVYLWRWRTEPVAVAGMARLRDIEIAWEALEPPPFDGAWSYFEPPPPAQGTTAFYHQMFEEAMAEYREAQVHVLRLQRETLAAQRLLLRHLDALLARNRRRGRRPSAARNVQREGPFATHIEDIAAQFRMEDGDDD